MSKLFMPNCPILLKSPMLSNTIFHTCKTACHNYLPQIRNMYPKLILLAIILFTFSTFTLTSLFFASCTQESKEDIIIQKTRYFDSVGFKVFNNYRINLVREGEAPGYQVEKFGIIRDHAVFQLKPEPKIERNFKKDTINIDFVKTFKVLNCYYLVCKNDFIRLDFKIKRDKYILYKGIPINKYLPFDTTKAIKVDTEWAYLVFPES